MVNPRHRAKLRSSSRKHTRRLANKHAKKVNITSNGIISSNWDKKQTLRQNYKRLGLLTVLNGTPGGSDKTTAEPKPSTESIELPEDDEEIKKMLGPGEGFIKRDAEGNVIKIIVGEQRDLNEIIEEEIKSVPAKTDVVRQLEERAARVIKIERYQSNFEESWVEKLIAKYGDDYDGMFWDKKLNSYQQTATQLKKKVQAYLKRKSI